MDTCICKTSSDTACNVRFSTDLIDSGLTISVGDVIEGSDATILISTDKSFNGNVTETVGDKNYTVALFDGVGLCNVSDLKAGDYNATVILNQTETFNASSKTINFTVKSKSITIGC